MPEAESILLTMRYSILLTALFRFISISRKLRQIGLEYIRLRSTYQLQGVFTLVQHKYADLWEIKSTAA